MLGDTFRRVRCAKISVCSVYVLNVLHWDSLARRQLFRISLALPGAGRLTTFMFVLFHCLNNRKMNWTIFKDFQIQKSQVVYVRQKQSALVLS